MSVSAILLLNAALISIAMVLLWLVSLRLKDASIVDIFWGIGFVLIAWATFAVTAVDLRSIMLVAMTTIWGVRLAVYLAWRNHGKGEDSRYKAMRDYRGHTFWWVSLITVFGLQGAVMWLISLPIQIGQADQPSLSMFGGAGVILWLIGFMFESIGDYQLARFKSAPQARGKVLDQGLWRYTRHPNYFGNALIWWGIFWVSASSSTWWLVLSPVLMTFLLLKVSGVALLEKGLAKRSAEYRDYIRRTSRFVPWPPKGDPISGKS
jgi:steroid 5-alpha reductase family enzyme